MGLEYEMKHDFAKGLFVFRGDLIRHDAIKVGFIGNMYRPVMFVIHVYYYYPIKHKFCLLNAADTTRISSALMEGAMNFSTTPTLF